MPGHSFSLSRVFCGFALFAALSLSGCHPSGGLSMEGESTALRQASMGEDENLVVADTNDDIASSEGQLQQKLLKLHELLKQREQELQEGLALLEQEQQERQALREQLQRERQWQLELQERLKREQQRQLNPQEQLEQEQREQE